MVSAAPLPGRKSIAQGVENLATSCTVNGGVVDWALLVAAVPQAAVAGQQQQRGLPKAAMRPMGGAGRLCLAFTLREVFA